MNLEVKKIIEFLSEDLKLCEALAQEVKDWTSSDEKLNLESLVLEMLSRIGRLHDVVIRDSL